MRDWGIYMVILLWIVCGKMHGQFLKNPSFEGPPGISLAPPSWEAYDVYSTPDTDPISCDQHAASEGETYLTLVTRGEEHVTPGSSENISTGLLIPLEPGKFYRLSMDLASRENFGHFTWETGYIEYNTPVFLRIYGADVSNQKGELLSESGTINHPDWERYDFYLVPLNEYHGLVLDVEREGGPPGWGNLVIDDLELTEVDDVPLDAGPLEIPNVFTPNGDGINDELVIKGLREGSTLMVYDRTGREVFSSNDYKQDWGGTGKSGDPLDQDTYWYVLLPSHLDEVFKGFIYLKRE